MASPDMSLELRRTLKTRAAARAVLPTEPDAAAPPASFAELDRRAGSHLCRIERKLDHVLREATVAQRTGTLRTLTATSLGVGLGMLLMTVFHL